MDQPTFDLDTLVAQLRQAAAAPSPRAEVKAVMQAAMADPEAVAAAMPDYTQDEAILFEDDTVSIWFCRFQPGPTVPPHDHQMSATIGVYRGVERNDFYENDPDGLIMKNSERRVGPGEVLQIGPSAIHAVGCDSAEPSCAIHAYLGRLTTVKRSLFDIQAGEVLPFTDENYKRLTGT